MPVISERQARLMARKLDILVNSKQPQNDFPNACYREDIPLALASFDPYTYVIFTLVMVLAPYTLYYIWIQWRRWEHKPKCAADHYSDITQALAYTLILFTFGGYSHTFNWVMVVAFYLGLWAYGMLVEVPFLRVSLPGWRIWEWRVWAVMLSALAVILALTAYHIVVAIHLDIFWPWYISLFILAWLVLLVGVLLARIDSAWWSQRRIVRLRTRRQQEKSLANNGYNSPNDISAPPTAPSGLNAKATALIQPIDSGMSYNDIEDAKHSKTNNTRSATPANKAEDAPTPMQRQLSGASTNSQTAGHNFKTRHSDELDTGRNNMDIDGASKVFTTAIVDSAYTVNQRRTSSGSNNGQNNPNIPENLPPTEAFCRQKEPDDAVGILEENVMDPTERLLDGLNVHIHHWQIFLILAFFTRFQDIVSQVSAGLVLACFMQGGIAYGFDAMLEPRYTMVVV